MTSQNLQKMLTGIIFGAEVTYNGAKVIRTNLTFSHVEIEGMGKIKVWGLDWGLFKEL